MEQTKSAESNILQGDKCIDINCKDLSHTLTFNIFNMLALYVVSYIP